MVSQRLRVRRSECGPKCFVYCCAARNGSARLCPCGYRGPGPSVRMTTRPPHSSKEGVRVVIRIRDRVDVRGQRRAERRYGSVVEFDGFPGLVRWDPVADGGGAVAGAESGKLTESGGRSKTGWHGGHRGREG
jgi:hypothetical protein